MKIKSLLIIILLQLILHTILYGQQSYQVIGYVTNIHEEPINAVNILLKQEGQNLILKQNKTDKNGYFSIKIDDEKRYVLVFSSLGFERKTIALEEIKNNNRITLIEKVYELNEVIATKQQAIKEMGDTVLFDAKSFKNGSEKNIEQLLKNIPGITVNQNGTIMVDNQEVEKIMIEGADFFEKGYKTLTKNMPAYPIKQIQLIKNFHHKSILKDLFRSKKVALNLTLDEQFKNILFGNIDASLGNDWYRILKMNFMNIKKHKKSYLNLNSNNIGDNLLGNERDYLSERSQDFPSKIFKVDPISGNLRLNSITPNISTNKYNLNNQKSISLNQIFDLSQKSKIKYQLLYHHDQKLAHNLNIDQFSSNGINFVNRQSTNNENNLNFIFGKLNYNYNSNDQETFESNSRISYQPEKAYSNLNFNDNIINSNLNSKHLFLENQNSYIKKINNFKYYIINAAVTLNSFPQKLTIKHPNDSLPRLNNQNIAENNLNTGLSIQYISRKNAQYVAITETGISYSNARFNTLNATNERFYFSNNNNNIVFNNFNLFQSFKLKKTIKNLALTGNIDFVQNFIDLSIKEVSKNNSKPLFINPSLSSQYSFSKNSHLFLLLSYHKKSIDPNNVSTNYYQTDFRSFKKGLNDIYLLDAINLTANYSLGSYIDRYFFNSMLIFVKNNNFISTKSNITQSQALSESMLFKNRTYLNFSNKFDYFVEKLSSNFKVEFNLSNSIYKNIINESQNRDVNVFGTNIGFEIKTILNNKTNFHFGSKWSNDLVIVNRKSSNTNLTTTLFLDVYYKLFKKFDFNILTERYYFSNFSKRNNLYFLDMNLMYKLKNEKMNFGIICRNLFNNNTFNFLNINDVGYNYSEFRLQPRMFLLSIEFRI